MRYVQLDGHPREDHPYNLRQLVTSFCPDTIIDSAPYSFQKAPTWFQSPSNHWTIKYHDLKGNGIIDILTQKRQYEAYSGAFQSLEFIKQVIS